MKGEIIAIGDELTSGRILNTTSGYAARKLFDAGYTIHAMSTIGDTLTLIGEALLRAINRVDFIIVTGGLGSTDDDLTNEAVSRALNRPTMPNLELLAQIRDHLQRQQAAPDSPLEKLAWLPSGADPLDPESRTAGYHLVHNETPIFFLPGVPTEMKALMTKAVLPKLAAWEAGSRLQTLQRIYKIFGMTEAEVNRSITSLHLDTPVRIGYYPVFPDVHLSILVRGTNQEASRHLFDSACHAVEETLGSGIYGCDGEELESVVGTLLNRYGFSLAVAESCSGGLLSHRLTSIPGSSSYFLGGVVSYANELKTLFLTVEPDLITRHGAVSEEVAIAMAQGVRHRTGADYGLAITGIAGPSGGTPDKPVGTVHIGICDERQSRAERCQFSGNRHRIQTMAAHTALNILRLSLQEKSFKQARPDPNGP